MTLKRTLERTRDLAISLAVENRAHARSVTDVVRDAQAISSAVLYCSGDAICEEDAESIARAVAVFAQAITVSFDDPVVEDARQRLAASIRARLVDNQRGRQNSAINDAIHFILADALLIAAAQVIDARGCRRRIQSDHRKRIKATSAAEVGT